MVFDHFIVPYTWHAACGGTGNVLTTFFSGKAAPAALGGGIKRLKRLIKNLYK